ncbi:hypothetical protein B0H11DRAFT_674248 [Mycena galericulata]|nr:hypothetical protein B0H11DRAFT_674248 [Mycena galericulata]
MPNLTLRYISLQVTFCRTPLCLLQFFPMVLAPLLHTSAFVVRFNRALTPQTPTIRLRLADIALAQFPMRSEVLQAFSR